MLETWKLTAACTMPSFISEPKNVRAVVGDRAKFKLKFSGNPQPGEMSLTNALASNFNTLTLFNFLAIVWYHNNKALINGERFRIITKDQKSTLHIKSVSFDDFGYYVCKAMNDAGEVITRAKLIESVKAYMIQEDIDEVQKKVEKKLSKKVKISRKASLTEETSLSSVNVEATVKSKKTKISKKSASESVNASASFKNKTQSKNIKAPTDESSQLTISRKQMISDDSSSDDNVETIREVIQITSRDDFEKLKNNEEFVEKSKAVDISRFGEYSNSVVEFSAILYMLEKGIATNDMKIMFQSDFFPLLKTPNFQSALVKLVEKKGYGEIVSEILSEKSVSEIEQNYANSVGLDAFTRMFETKSFSMKEIIESFDVADFSLNELKK